MTPRLKVSVPDSLRAPCAKPDPEGVATVGDLAAFSLRQDAALRICSARGDALVEVLDGVNKAWKRKRWPF